MLKGIKLSFPAAFTMYLPLLTMDERKETITNKQAGTAPNWLVRPIILLLAPKTKSHYGKSLWGAHTFYTL